MKNALRLYFHGLYQPTHPPQCVADQRVQFPRSPGFATTSHFALPLNKVSKQASVDEVFGMCQ